MVMKFLFIKKLIEIDKHKIDWIKNNYAMLYLLEILSKYKYLLFKT